jgi:dephospho-CoA kinase
LSRILLILSGYIGSGKDTFASFLIEKGYKRFAMADPLKKIAMEHFGWDGVKNDKGRKLLQILGTEAGRKYNPNIWIDKTINNLYNHFVIEKNEKAVITDCRFSNELDLLRKFSLDNNIYSYAIKINRPGSVDYTGHESEQNYGRMGFEYIMDNNGTLDDFKNKVLEKISSLEISISS